MTLAVLVLVGAATKLPGAERFFGLQAVPALLSFLPILVLAVAFWGRRRGLPVEAPVDLPGWVLWTVGSAAVQFFVMSLVTWSRPPGAFAFAIMVLYAAGFHGFSLRVTVQEPFIAVGTLVSLAIALVLCPREDTRLLLAVVGPMALAVELTAGSFAVGQDQAREERDRLRAAVNAQLLEAQSARAVSLEGALVDVLGRSHDVNNTVTGALLDAEALEEYAKDGRTPAPQEFAMLTGSVRTALQQISNLAHAMRDEGRGVIVRPPEFVDARVVCEEATRSVALLYPNISIELDVPPGQHHVSVGGGLASLRSVVDNLLLNACQGNGKEGSSVVRLSVANDRSGALLRLIVEDDGPGFEPDQLAAPITPFVTTKRHGTGLGLYTTERLVGASGGTVSRANRPAGGALVELTLQYAVTETAVA